MAIERDVALNLLYRALDEELGVRVRVDDAKAFRSELSDIRREQNDPRLDELVTFVTSDNQVYIVRKGAEL